VAERALDLRGSVIVFLKATNGLLDQFAERGDIGGKSRPNGKFGPPVWS
jgi:hypothetical protein